MSYEKLLHRSQCPCCFADMEQADLIDETTWESLTVQGRANLCELAGITGRHGAKSYNDLCKLSDGELLCLCDYKCNGCDTYWPVADLLAATTTPQQTAIYRREHTGEGSDD